MFNTKSIVNGVVVSLIVLGAVRMFKGAASYQGPVSLVGPNGVPRVNVPDVLEV